MLSLSVVDPNNKNGEKFLEYIHEKFNSNIDTNSGLMGNKINEYLDNKLKSIELNLDKSIDSIADKIGSTIMKKLGEACSKMASDAFQILAFGAICYSMCQSIRVMFFGNKSSNGKAKPMDKMLLAYFTYFILRVINTVIQVRGGIHGN